MVNCRLVLKARITEREAWEMERKNESEQIGIEREIMRMSQQEAVALRKRRKRQGQPLLGKLGKPTSKKVKKYDRRGQCTSFFEERKKKTRQNTRQSLIWKV